jgi:iron complex outermembrane receptor protein
MPAALFSQQALSGSVVDAATGAPLEGASIFNLASKQATMTGADGRFTLNGRAGDTIQISFLGYHDQEILAGEQPLFARLRNSPLMIDQVVISANRYAANRALQPLAISSISLKQIQETAPSSLYQVLNRTAGVYMVDLGNDQHSLSIRQPISTRAVYLFLEDGIPIRPNGVFNHNALLEINLPSIRNIEVIRGPASSVYGSSAIGGAINFMTHQPTLEPAGRLATQIDNIGFRMLEAQGSATFGKLGVLASGSFSGRRDGYRQNSDYDKWGGTVSTRLKINNSTFLNTSISIIDYRTDATVSVDSARFFGRDYSSFHYFAYRKVDALRAQSTLRKNWNERQQTDLSIYFRDNFIGQNATHTIRVDPRDPRRGTSQINDLGFKSYGGQAQHIIRLNQNGGSFVAGGAFDYSPVDNETRFITVTRDEKGNFIDFQDPDSLLTLSRVDIYNVAAFTQLELPLGRRFNLVAGLRYDDFLYAHDNFLDSTAFSGAPDSRDAFRNLTPKIGLTYNPNARLGLYANFSQGFVPPQVGELYRGVKVPVLGPMEFYNYELGAWYRLGELGYFEVNLYNLQGTNEIINVLLDDGTFENRNAGKTAHYGVEYSLALNLTRELILRLNATNARHLFREYPERGVDFNGNDMPGAPAWIANSEIQFRPNWMPGFRAGLEWFRVGSYYMDAANTEKYPGYHLFNLRLGYDWKRYSVWGNVINLNDELYAVNASKSGAGKRYSFGDPRSFAAGMAVRLGK